MKHLFSLAKPVLHKMDPEDAHRLTIQGLKHIPLCPAPKADPMLAQEIYGMNFVHPLGLAAGFDKNCDVPDSMHKIGFSFVECGTVTPKPQVGNPRPRVFRDAQNRAVINRMGFPNEGADVFFKNLERAKAKNATHIIGVNIGKNKETENALDDYKFLAERAQNLADYVTINISSPNTPGLRDLQNGEFVRACVDVVRQGYDGAVLVKFAPDLTEEQIDDVVLACLETADGLIVTNTTLERPSFLPADFGAQTGGLSGRPLKEKSLGVLRAFIERVEDQLPVISAGGIENATDVLARMKAGACLVQLYTAMVFDGPSVVHNIVRDLPDLLRREGYKTLDEAQHADNTYAYSDPYA